MKKTDKFIPVITVVVYYGEKEWDGAKSLHEMLNIPEEMAIQYSQKHHTEKTVIMTAAGATNTKLDYNSLAKGEESMCTLFDEIAKEGEAIGEVRGRAIEIVESGIEFGLSENDILSRLQKKLDVSLQMAQEYLVMFGKQTL